MRCDDLDPAIEAIAEGLAPGEEAAAHLDSCAACRTRVHLAREVLRLLESREVPEPSVHFTSRVMAAIGDARWRAEQMVDVGFNVAVAAGVLSVVAAALALAWNLGWFTPDPAIVELVFTVVSRWLASAAGQAPMVLLSALLLSSALGLWWWVEGEETL